MQPRTYLRRFKNVNLCCFASRRQLSFLCARSRLTAAISPGDLGFGEGDCANTGTALNEIDATTTAAIRRIDSSKEITLSVLNFPLRDDFEQHRAQGCLPQIRLVEGR